MKPSLHLNEFYIWNGYYTATIFGALHVPATPNATTCGTLVQVAPGSALASMISFPKPAVIISLVFFLCITVDARGEGYQKFLTKCQSNKKYEKKSLQNVRGHRQLSWQSYLGTSELRTPRFSRFTMYCANDQKFIMGQEVYYAP